MDYYRAAALNGRERELKAWSVKLDARERVQEADEAQLSRLLVEAEQARAVALAREASTRKWWRR